MAQYFITYLGGEKPSSPEEGQQHMSKYMAWLSSLGDSAVSPANPLKNTTTVNSDGTVTTGSTTAMSGFTIIEADSMESALQTAKACPFLDVGGSLEVSELIKMSG
jgi:hypothetical protein